jgi:hypothetical protein
MSYLLYHSFANKDIECEPLTEESFENLTPDEMKAVFLLIIEHYLVTSGNQLNLFVNNIPLPYNAVVSEKGVSFDFSKLPSDVVKIISKFIHTIKAIKV